MTAITCSRCGKSAAPPPAVRVAHMGAASPLILAAICASCWSEWEGVEVKVINEYRLNFMEPAHRETLKRACADFLKLPLDA